MKYEFQPFTEEQSNIYITMLMAENNNDDNEEDFKYIKEEFFIQVLLKRIEVMKLPILFNVFALGSIYAFCDRVGSVILFLIDCLENFEGQIVTVNMLGTLYPVGFYTEESMIDKIDNYIKQGKSKWSKVY